MTRTTESLYLKEAHRKRAELLAQLRGLADERGIVTETQRGLAEHLGIGPTLVRYHIMSLAKSGDITIERVPGQGRPQQITLVEYQPDTSTSTPKTYRCLHSCCS